MDTLKKFPNRILFALAVLCSLLLFLAWWMFSKEKSFPPIPVGTYVGVISNFPSQPGVTKDTTFLVERFENSSVAMMVVFKNGWSPHSIELLPLGSEEVRAALNPQLTLLKPLQIVNEEDVYVFTGSFSKGNYQGIVKENGKRDYEWRLRRIDSRSLLSAEYEEEITNVNMKHWLAAKSAFRDFQAQLNQGDQIIVEQIRSSRTLNRYIADEPRLRSRAEKEETRLSNRLKSARVEKKQRSGDIKSLVRELEVLGRITGRGKTVRLLRRLAARENKWYRAHWREEIDASQLDKIVGRNSGIDLNQIDREYAKTKEIRALRAEIRKEKILIKQLNEEYQAKLAPHLAEQKPSPAATEKTTKEPAKKSLWNKLLGG